MNRNVSVGHSFQLSRQLGYSFSFKEPVGKDTESLFDKFLGNSGDEWNPENQTIQKGENFAKSWVRLLKKDEPVMVKNGTEYSILGCGCQIIKWEGKTDTFRIITNEEDPIAWQALIFIMTKEGRNGKERRLYELEHPEDNKFWGSIKQNLSGHGYQVKGKRRFAHRDHFNADTTYDKDVIQRFTSIAKNKNVGTNARKKKKTKAEKSESSNISASFNGNSSSGLENNSTIIAEIPASVEPETSRSRKRPFVEEFKDMMHLRQASPQDKRACLQLLLDQGIVHDEAIGESTEAPLQDDHQLCPQSEPARAIPPPHPLETRLNASGHDETTNRSNASDVSNPGQHSTAVRNDDVDDAFGGSSVNNITDGTAAGANVDSSNIVNSYSKGPIEEGEFDLFGTITGSSKPTNQMSLDEELWRNCFDR